MVVLSTLIYGETVYGSASKSALKTIEPENHHKGVKIALGVFSICKTENAICEAGLLKQYNNDGNENPHK
jgi:exo-beta-1,3-glucanase (GH17 family)